MTEDECRKAVIDEALSWLGTPFQDQTAVKGVGVDCAMLCIESFAVPGIIARVDPRPYSRQWHLHHSEELFLNIIDRLAPRTEEIRPGNIIVFREGRCFSHCGIVGYGNTLIHAWYRRREVIVSPLFQTDLNFMPADNSPRPKIVFDPWKDGGKALLFQPTR